ncbi:MAG TPA: serine hydrolase domain-containing protein [Streptosporangiaceae bacterium]|nr:serine hydrolase domain-containing protein [Streptosporangiaceae bacterium]
MVKKPRIGWRSSVNAPSLAAAIAVALAAGLIACSPAATTANGTRSATAVSLSAQASGIAAIVRKAIRTYHLRAVIVRVTKGNQDVITQAFGPSLTGQPATPAMHFRNGAVAFAYVATLLMEYVDEHKVNLNDTINRWVPTLPESNKVTLKMLANQTSGYPDFETDPAWTAAFNADPFQIFTYQQRVNYAFRRPVQFKPGTNWSYAHTNFMILGHILSMIGKKPLATLLQQKVIGPMGLTSTTSSVTSTIPEPVLHSYSSERKVALHVPAKVTFYEEATYWNTEWGTPDGANETTNIYDMTKTAAAVGTGKLLSRSSYHAMTDPNLLGFGHAQASCAPSCFTQIPAYNYGLGVVRAGSWILQNPLVSGYSATEAYLPSQKIAIAVVTTFEPAAFNSQGVEPNASDPIFRQIGAYMAPADAPPTGK